MRVTHAMMTNTTLINISRNMRHLDSLINQIESTKKIRNPSDDPIIASRALKFRTNVSETAQFQRNVQSGLAWMNVTESAFLTLNEGLLKKVHELCVEGATGTEEYSDKLALTAELRELAAQIGLEMNQTYAGRYVFSGYRTDQPPVFTENNDLSYVITQQFDLADIEKTMSYQKVIDQEGYDSATSQAIVRDINILKLAYNNVNFNFTIPDENGVPVIEPGIQGTGSPPIQYKVVTKGIADINAYAPPGSAAEDGSAANPYVVHYIMETGELVLSDAAVKTFKDGTTVTYNKEGFRAGELNPLVYFGCIEVLDKEVVPVPDYDVKLNTPVDANGKYIFSVDRIDLDTGATETYAMISEPTLGPILNINGVAYDLWHYPAASIPQYTYPTDAPTIWENTYAITDTAKGINVHVIQRVSMEGNTYKADYSLINYGATALTFDFLTHMNTQLGDADKNLLYNGDNIPTNISSKVVLTQDTTDPPILAGIISATGSINIGNGTSPASFDLFGDGTPMSDSAHAALWKGMTAAPDIPVSMSTSYGVSAVKPTDEYVLTPGTPYDMENQYIRYEFSTNTYVVVNALAKNVYTDKMYADILRLVDFVESLTLSEPQILEQYYNNPPHNLTGDDLTNAVNSQMADEKSQLKSVLYDRFNNMLYIMDRHAENTTEEHTDLGSRMHRLELIQNRLEQDETTYTQLMSDNEDTDMVKALIIKSAAEAAYQASLRASTNIMQMTLADFIR